MKRFLAPLVWGSLLLVVLIACTPLTSPYSEQAYRNATTLKAESLALIAKSGDSYGSHRAEAEALMLSMRSAYEYSAGAPRNEVVTNLWAQMINPQSGLMGDFLKVWRENGPRNSEERFERTDLISDAFDVLICVEATKKDVDV